MAAFKRVSLDFVPHIVKVLKSDIPGSVVPCQMLEMYVDCQRALPHLDVRLFVPGGKVDTFGTFFLHVPEHRGGIIFHSTNPDIDQLRRQIIALPDVDWNTVITLGPIHDRFDSMIQKIMAEKRLSLAADPNPADNLSMTRERALELDVNVPEGFELRPITVEQAAVINNLWPHRGSRTEMFIEGIIRTRGGVALYQKGSDEMLSWALYSLVGGVGMIQTAEFHRRKGYADIVARYLTKEVAKYGGNPQVQVVHGKNGVAHSRRMFQNMGYSFTHIVHWYIVTRTCKSQTPTLQKIN